MGDGTVRVLVIDDTVVYRKIVRDVLAEIPGVDVVGVAADGQIALQKIEQLAPDAITLDLEMPKMDGLEVLRRLRDAKSPVRAIVISAFTTEAAAATISALKLGALDFILKPSGKRLEENAETLRRHLRSKIETITRLKSVRRLPAQPAPSANASVRPAGSNIARRMARIAAAGVRPDIVALGISTGGPNALAKMMPRLPADLGAPLVIVQHMPPMFTKSLAESLDQSCSLTVREAEDGQGVEPGHALIAPGGRQMKLEKEAERVVVRITDDPRENSCRPSVDYLFRSVAEIYGPATLAVIMTGMGNDGTAGCRQLKQHGARIVIQDEASCVVYGMPKAVVDEGLADLVVPLDELGRRITGIVGKGIPACR